MPQIPYDELPACRLFSLELPDESQRLLATTQLRPYWQANTYHQSQYMAADWLAKPDGLANRRTLLGDA